MDKFKEFMADLILPDANLEDLQARAKEVADEVMASENEKAELQAKLTETNDKYNALKDRTLESLFASSKEKSEPEKKEPPKKETELKTFKDIYRKDAQWNI